MKLFPSAAQQSEYTAKCRAMRKADRARRHVAIRAALADTRDFTASSQLFATGDFYAASVAKRIEMKLTATVTG